LRFYEATPCGYLEASDRSRTNVKDTAEGICAKCNGFLYQEGEAAPLELEAAPILLFYLPSYCPQLSDIAPIWQALKHHQMQQRSQTAMKAMKQAVEQALARTADALRSSTADALRSSTADALRSSKAETTNLLQAAA
jgi:hypothetical protein